MTVDEVYKNLSEAKIPDRWKTLIYDAYCSGWKTTILFAEKLVNKCGGKWFDLIIAWSLVEE